METVLDIPIIGKQAEGSSPASIKQMAMRAMASLGKKKYAVVADIGAGRGELTQLIAPHAQTVLMLDDFEEINRPPNAQFIKTDLNSFWNIPDNSLDFAFSLEVIEHIENSRHFMREITRILKPNGYGFVTTPNNLNLFSRLNFLFKGENRFFKDNCYPAHITMLTKKDLQRICQENGLEVCDFFYNYTDTIPLISKDISIKRAAFSSSIGVLFRKINQLT
jgi:2-polyprenyl-3-methyl-5-hydroxy-6-metoxy-1,4-benzoquinol methylase